MKILLIRLSAMGDVVMTSPVIRWIDEQLDADIHYLTKAAYFTVVKFNPRISKLHIFDGDIDKTIEALKQEQFDLIIDLHKNLRSRRIVSALSVKSISYDKRSIEKWLYLKIGINRLNRSHVIDRYAHALRSIGIGDDGLGMEFHIDPDAKEKIEVPVGDYSVIVAGGTYVTKRIPVHVIKELIDDGGQYVILGGDDVDPEIAALQGDNTHNLINKTSLHESAALIERANTIITGDTGLMHISAALQKPIIVIWGSTNEEFGFYPYYGRQSSAQYVSVADEELSCRPCSKYGRPKCPKGHMKCLMDIQTSAVKQAFKTLST